MRKKTTVLHPEARHHHAVSRGEGDRPGGEEAAEGKKANASNSPKTGFFSLFSQTNI